MWVLKVPGALLRGWLRTPDRYCALSFDASSGAGWLFASYVDLVGQQLGQQLDGGEGPARELAAQQLVDLLVCSVQADARVLSSSDSAVRAAHLCRIEDYARRRATATRRRNAPRRPAASPRATCTRCTRRGPDLCPVAARAAPDRAEQSCAARPYPWPASRINGALPTSRISRAVAPLWTHAGASAPPHGLIRSAVGVTDHASSP